MRGQTAVPVPSLVRHLDELHNLAITVTVGARLVRGESALDVRFGTFDIAVGRGGPHLCVSHRSIRATFQPIESIGTYLVRRLLSSFTLLARLPRPALGREQLLVLLPNVLAQKLGILLSLLRRHFQRVLGDGALPVLQPAPLAGRGHNLGLLVPQLVDLFDEWLHGLLVLVVVPLDAGVADQKGDALERAAWGQTIWGGRGDVEGGDGG